MKVVGRKVLDDFCRQHADGRKQVAAWLAEAEEAAWLTLQDVKARYPNASVPSENRVILNLKGNHYRLDIQIAYASQIVLVKRIGTHADYNTWTF